MSKKTFTFPKINYYGKSKINIPEVEMELRDTDKGPELSICGKIWNARHTDIICGGQCLDTMNKFLSDNDLFKTLYRLWKLHHLNGLHAGTFLQEQALSKLDPKYRSYESDCQHLKEIGLLYDGAYRYGSSWLYREIPEEDMKTIKNLLGI